MASSPLPELNTIQPQSGSLHEVKSQQTNDVGPNSFPLATSQWRNMLKKGKNHAWNPLKKPSVDPFTVC
eukprot:7996086-Ditylum_brightwellii.AAC.1